MPTTYTANCLTTRYYEVLHNHTQVGTLAYPKWYSNLAVITLHTGEKLTTVKQSIWKNTIHVVHNGITVMVCTTSWKGITKIIVQGTEAVYYIKNRSIYHNNYVLESADKEELIRIKHKYNYKTFAYNYELTTTHYLEDSVHKLALLIITLYYVHNNLSATSF